MPEDRQTGQALAYPEAVLLTNPMDPELRGEVPFMPMTNVGSNLSRIWQKIPSADHLFLWLFSFFGVGAPLSRALKTRDPGVWRR